MQVSNRRHEVAFHEFADTNPRQAVGNAAQMDPAAWLLLFDVSGADSLDNISEWIGALRTKKVPAKQVFIVGLKRHGKRRSASKRQAQVTISKDGWPLCAWGLLSMLNACCY